jgi:hypothetical protein
VPEPVTEYFILATKLNRNRGLALVQVAIKSEMSKLLERTTNPRLRAAILRIVRT